MRRRNVHRRQGAHARRGRGWVLAAAGLAVVLVAAGVTAALTGRPRPGRQATDPAPTSTLPALTTAPPTTSVPSTNVVWMVAWGSAMAWGGRVPAVDATIRDLATVATGGSAVKIRISNLFGNAALAIGAATVGLSAGGAAVTAGTIHALTFGGTPATTIPEGQVAYSDPVNLVVSAGQTLAISVYVTAPDLVSQHACCTRIAAYYTPNQKGNLTATVTGAGFSYASPDIRLVDNVDVLQSVGQGAIVVVGDSITDGYNSVLRWTHVLQERIDALPPAERRPVVNEGITADAILPATPLVHTDELTGGGQAGVVRLTRDALQQPGVSEVVMFLGTNDLWFGSTAAEVIEGYQQAISLAHAAGVRIIGVTLLPRQSTANEIWTAQDQANLEQVDQWIRTSGAFNGVLDFASAVADRFDGQCVPTSMFGHYDSGDHLHPNPAGQTAMADSVDPAVLQLPALPQVPLLVGATPTPGCAQTSPG